MRQVYNICPMTSPLVTLFYYRFAINTAIVSSENDYFTETINHISAGIWNVENITTMIFNFFLKKIRIIQMLSHSSHGQ